MRNLTKVAFIVFLGCISFAAFAKNKKYSTLQIADNEIEIHQNFNALLKKHVSASGKVNYKSFLKDKTKLQNYLSGLEKTDLTLLNKNQQMAFWVNVYNAATIDQVLRNYPVKSIKNIAEGKVWDLTLPYLFGGKTYSLNQIENVKLLQTFNDARIHFVINCAAISCPKLHNNAYTDKNIQTLLNTNTLTFLNNSNFNVITKSSVKISQIFNWFKPDFIKAEGNLIKFLNKYSKQQILDKQNIEFLDYNWDLNGE